MTNLYYDLHIHSCLSPCGDDESTPADIAGLAAVKGLDVIALTDHNSCRNTPAAKRAADEYGILFIPGMELTTSEEIHVVCLLETVEAALDWDRYVYEKLFKIKNKASIFGNQLIMNEADEVIGTEENILINATSISFDEVWDELKKFDGVMIPAHIEKSSSSLIANLGFVPENSKFRTAEVKDMIDLHSIKKTNPYIEQCRIIKNSDAHKLMDINEPDLTLPVKTRSVRAVLDYLRGE